MIDGREDQASGLRRLFRRAPPTVLALFASGRDPLALARRALGELARGAGRTAVLDEGRGSAALGPALNLPDGGDLLHLIDGRTGIDALLGHASPDLCHLAVSGAALALPLLDDDQRDRIIAGLHRLQRHCRLIVVHGASADVLQPSPFVLAAPTRLMVVEASSRGVTEGYAMIKRLAGAGVGDLGIAVAGARDRDDAHALFSQLDSLVRRRVGLPLRLFGELERDDLGAQIEGAAPVRGDHAAGAAFVRWIRAWADARRVAGATGA